ncbi:hypothetical protein RCL1_005516 [Eukaryota sp. TZLM3-RCL]
MFTTSQINQVENSAFNSIEEGFFYVFKELLHNSLTALKSGSQYSFDSSIDITLSHIDHNYRLQVQDSGVGMMEHDIVPCCTQFGYSLTSSSTGTGLKNIVIKTCVVDKSELVVCSSTIGQDMAAFKFSYNTLDGVISSQAVIVEEKPFKGTKIQLSVYNVEDSSTLISAFLNAYSLQQLPVCLTLSGDLFFDSLQNIKLTKIESNCIKITPSSLINNDLEHGIIQGLRNYFNVSEDHIVQYIYELEHLKVIISYAVCDVTTDGEITSNERSFVCSFFWK